MSSKKLREENPANNIAIIEYVENLMIHAAYAGIWVFSIQHNINSYWVFILWGNLELSF